MSPEEGRWTLVRYLLDHNKASYKNVFKVASKLLAEGGDVAKPGTVRNSYQNWEKTLPPDQRRRKTHRPNLNASAHKITSFACLVEAG